MYRILLIFIATSCSLAIAPARAADSPAGGRELQLSATFVDTTVGHWTQTEAPLLAATPTLDAFETAVGHRPSADFGLSFNCAIAASGALGDCRAIYAAPDEAASAALVRALSPLVRLQPESAALAARQAYRVTINAALTTRDASGQSRECLPPFCMIEMATPPPPPQLPRDPVLRAAVAQADACFADEWEKARNASFAAEAAQREAKGAVPDAAARAAALDLVHARQRLMACMTRLSETAQKIPIGAADRDIVKQRVEGMQFSYFSQTKFELAILIGLLDPKAAAIEMNSYYPR